jgi:hypothetical protein
MLHRTVLAQHFPHSKPQGRNHTAAASKHSISATASRSAKKHSGGKTSSSSSSPGLARLKRYSAASPTLQQRPPFPPPSTRPQQQQRSEPPSPPPERKLGPGTKPTQQRPHNSKLQQLQQAQPASTAQPVQQSAQPQEQQQRSMGTSSKIVTNLRTSQDDLVDYLIRSRLVKSQRVANALRAVDRGKYVNPAFATRTDAYAVRIPLSAGQCMSTQGQRSRCAQSPAGPSCNFCCMAESD